MRKELMKYLTLVLASFIIGAIFGQVLINRPYTRAPSSEPLSLIPKLTIIVYDKQGNLIQTFTKVGDIPTANFLKWIMHTWWYSASVQVVNGEWTTEEGESGLPGAESYHTGTSTTVSGVTGITLKVELGNGTTNPTINDYAMESVIVEVPVDYLEYNNNSTHMWLIVRATYTATSNITITEIGLFGFMYHAISSSNKWVMLFHDVIDPLDLQTDQTIEIRYEIYVQYA